MAEKDYVAFYVGGPRDGLVEHINDAVETVRIADDDTIKAARLGLIPDTPAQLLKTGLYERGKTTRDTPQMNVALYHWRGWSDDG